MTPTSALVLALRVRSLLVDRLAAAGRDRGDVPGWVLVTLMTAGLVTILWAIAGDRLATILNDALDDVAP